jgi:hypothetical protein
MTKALRSLIAAALFAPVLAAAQTTTTPPIGVPPSLQVARLAPQLVFFVGGQANFDSLVNGLGLGSPVTLTTALPNGQVQVVNFTPQGTVTATQIAQILEAARQNLISLGLATPTAQQVAITLTGGALPLTTGNVLVAGLLPAANLPVPVAARATGSTSTVTTTTISPNGNPSPAALIQGQGGAGGTTPPSPAQLIQNRRSGNTSDTPSTLTEGQSGTGGTTPPSPAQLIQNSNATTIAPAPTPGAPLAPSLAPPRAAPLAPAR